MTEITIDTKPTQETDRPRNPSDLLMALIIALLAPMFLGVSAGDISLARMAAAETVNAYRARNHADLIAVAQIVAFGLAALGSLSLSLADDLSLAMTLRLRGNANALNRSAEQIRRALAKSHAEDPAPYPVEMAAASDAWFPLPEDDDMPNPGMLFSPQVADLLAAEAQARLEVPEQRNFHVPPPTPEDAPDAAAEKRHQAMWAIAMVKEAGELSATIPNLPPAERKAASIRAAAMSTAAHDLLYGPSGPPPIPTAPRLT